MTQTYEAWRITYQSSEHAARAAFERMMELEQGNCLHQIAEPAENRFEALISYLRERMKYSHARHGHTLRFVELKLEDAQEIESILCSAKLAAAPQAVQPAVPVAHSHKFTDGHRTLQQDVFSAIHDYAATKPEQDPDDPESWESWFEAAFDLLGTRVGQIFEEHAGRTAPAHPAEGVPALTETYEDWVAGLGFELDAAADGVWQVIEDTGARREANLTERVLWKELIEMRSALAATHPTQQGLDAQLAKLTTAYKELSGIFHDQVVAQQAAWIEWQHGNGAEAAMQWIENGLCGPGHIPDEDEPYGKEAQAWFDANRSDPFPTCNCGKPSNQLWMGHGFCSEAHYDEFRAAQAKQGGA